MNKHSRSVLENPSYLETGRAVKKYFDFIGCDAAAVDMFGSAAGLIKPPKKAASSRILVCSSIDTTIHMVIEKLEDTKYYIMPDVLRVPTVDIHTIKKGDTLVSLEKPTVEAIAENESIVCSDTDIPIGCSMVKKTKKVSVRGKNVFSDLALDRVGSYVVCEVMKRFSEKRDNIFNIHGLCYVSGRSGLRAALGKLQPILVVCLDYMETKYSEDLGKFFVEKTAVSNQNIFSIVDSIGGFTTVVGTGYFEEDFLHIGGGLYFLKVLIPVYKKARYIFNSSSVLQAVTFIHDFVMKTSSFDLREG